jgi:glycosyltransferase involved in cell wall biosynthesis
VLLEAVEAVLHRRPGGLELVLAGGVEEGGGNRRFVDATLARIGRSPGRHAIEVLGYVPAGQLDGVFAAADVFVLPSTAARQLSTSSVLFRAMGAGLAVVASEVGTVPEAVRHGETGLLVPPGDAAALGEALQVLVDDSSLRSRLGQASRARLEAEHSAARVAEKVARIYERVSHR